MQAIKQCLLALVTLLAGFASAHAQELDITPLVGGTFGGTMKLEQSGAPTVEAHLRDALSFGISGGIRFDADECEGCNVIEFRWVREHTHLGIRVDPLVPTPLPTAYTISDFHPALTVDRFLGDFTREWAIQETRMVRPFLTFSAGAARLSAPAGSTTEVAFGFGTGIKIFPGRQWGARFQVEYLPIVMWGEVQRVACAVGCIVVANGGLVNQFQLTLGPMFRF